MGDTSETNTKVLSQELFLGVVALNMPIQKNHYVHDMGPFPGIYCHILYHGFEGLSVITVPIHEGEARGRGQLSFDNPDVAMV